VVSVLAIAFLESRSGDKPTAEAASAGTVSVPAGISIGGPFHLTDDTGRNVTDADYRGRWMLGFFGYTNCPDDCPLTLQKMATALENLGHLPNGSRRCSSRLIPRETPQPASRATWRILTSESPA
jgi:cytochrome oxidase Cu insertion factor (SCO1/SenC/PrrC family)